MPTVSSRTPEGESNCCPVCGSAIHIEPSALTGDAPCPRCGHLLWFFRSSDGLRLYSRDDVPAAKRRKITALIDRFKAIMSSGSFTQEVGADSLDIVELVLELEEEFDLTIPDDQAEKIRTVGDAIDVIESVIREDPE